jgi:hypothetical protein
MTNRNEAQSQSASQDSDGTTDEMTFESDPIYPHGKLSPKTLHGNEGYLLALQYKNPRSLGKALRALRGLNYWTPAENDRAAIWLSEDAARKLPHRLSERLAYLAEFEEQEKVVGKCEKCKANVSDLLNIGRKQVLLTCLKCSPYKDGTTKASRARFEAVKVLAQRENKFKELRASRLNLRIAA